MIRKALLFWSILALCITGIAGTGYGADEAAAYRRVKFTKVEGEVLVRLAGQAKWVRAKPDMVLRQDDMIKTKKAGNATIIFDENGSFETKDHDSIDLYEDTVLVLTKLSFDKKTQDKKTLLDMSIGKIVANAAKLRTKDSTFEVKTPTSVVGVRGTNYLIEYRPNK